MASSLYKQGAKTTNKPSSPQFLVLTGTSQKLSEVSPFLVAKALDGIAGTVKSVKKLASGDLLVCTANDQQSRNLLNCKFLAHIPIEVSPHNSLNNSKGVIYAPDLKCLSESEIENGLKEQNVDKVKQITTKKGDKIEKTPLFILTFSTPNLPDKIIAGYISINVRPYIPNPLRCFKCQRFGHGNKGCRGVATCYKCGGTDHWDDVCTSAVKCINCKGNHPANSKECIKWHFEKEIQRLQVVHKLSFPEARKKAESILPPRQNDSYANVTKKRTRTIETQVDLATILTATSRFNKQSLPNLPSSTAHKRLSPSENSDVSSKPPKQLVTEAQNATSQKDTQEVMDVSEPEAGTSDSPKEPETISSQILSANQSEHEKMILTDPEKNKSTTPKLPGRSEVANDGRRKPITGPT